MNFTSTNSMLSVVKFKYNFLAQSVACFEVIKIYRGYFHHSRPSQLLKLYSYMYLS